MKKFYSCCSYCSSRLSSANQMLVFVDMSQLCRFGHFSGLQVKELKKAKRKDIVKSKGGLKEKLRKKGLLGD